MSIALQIAILGGFIIKPMVTGLNIECPPKKLTEIGPSM